MLYQKRLFFSTVSTQCEGYDENMKCSKAPFEIKAVCVCEVTSETVRNTSLQNLLHIWCFQVLVIFNKKQLNLILFCKLGTVVCTHTHICVCVVQCYLYYKMLMLNRCHWDWEGWVQISMDLLIVWMIYYETSSWMLYLQEGGICLVLNLLVFHVCWAFSSWKIHLYLLMPTGNYLL